MLTEKEKSLLHFIVDNPSSFNGDKIDFSKPFLEQNWEGGGYEISAWYGYPELKDYVNSVGNDIGVDTVAKAKGVLGSLAKKRFIQIDPDDDFIVIGMSEFNKIKEELYNINTIKKALNVEHLKEFHSYWQLQLSLTVDEMIDKLASKIVEVLNNPDADEQTFILFGENDKYEIDMIVDRETKSCLIYPTAYGRVIDEGTVIL